MESFGLFRKIGSLVLIPAMLFIDFIQHIECFSNRCPDSVTTIDEFAVLPNMLIEVIHQFGWDFDRYFRHTTIIRQEELNIIRLQQIFFKYIFEWWWHQTVVATGMFLKRWFGSYPSSTSSTNSEPIVCFSSSTAASRTRLQSERACLTLPCDRW